MHCAFSELGVPEECVVPDVCEYVSVDPWVVDGVTVVGVTFKVPSGAGAPTTRLAFKLGSGEEAPSVLVAVIVKGSVPCGVAAVVVTVRVVVRVTLPEPGVSDAGENDAVAPAASPVVPKLYVQPFPPLLFSVITYWAEPP